MTIRETLLGMSQAETGRNVGSKGTNAYREAHKCIGDDHNESLKQFLRSSMDETRLYYAEEYAAKVLAGLGYPGTERLRSAVARRETSNDLDYERHRDHAAHTVNNYLLGWYIFANSKRYAQEFAKHANKRDGINRRDLDTIDCALTYSDEFSRVWPIASLLHDIGYLLEGGVDASSIAVRNKRIQRGAECVDDFFHHGLWNSLGLQYARSSKHMSELVGVDLPSIGHQSINGIADNLRSLGDLEKIRRQTVGKLDAAPPCLRGPVFSDDAFEIWQLHFDFSSPKMSQRFVAAEEVFRLHIESGMSPLGVRVLDHGVCSGMLILWYATICQTLLQEVPNTHATNPIQSQLKDIFESQVEAKFKYDDLAWWQDMVWATGATAIHNIEQGWPADLKPEKLLRLDDDPLAYLGILVDIIQEWDRNSSAGDSSFSKKLPTQGSEVELGINKSKVEVAFLDKQVANKVIRTLSETLAKWDQLVSITTARRHA